MTQTNTKPTKPKRAWKKRTFNEKIQKVFVTGRGRDGSTPGNHVITLPKDYVREHMPAVLTGERMMVRLKWDEHGRLVVKPLEATEATDMDTADTVDDEEVDAL